MTIKEFIKPKPQRILFQVRIDKSIYMKLLAKLGKSEVSRQAFLEAAIQQYLQELDK